MIKAKSQAYLIYCRMEIRPSLALTLQDQSILDDKSDAFSCSSTPDPKSLVSNIDMLSFTKTLQDTMPMFLVI